jgi:hypothetical protein
MGKGKKKGGRKDEFITDIPMAERTREFEGLLETIGPDNLKERIAASPRDVLDRWVAEIAGRPPHESHDDAFVATMLGRYIDGDKNWGDDPRRTPQEGEDKAPEAPVPLQGDEAEAVGESTAPAEVEDTATAATTPHTPAETPSKEEDAMEKNGTKSNSADGKTWVMPKATPKTGKKGSGKKTTAPKSVPPKKEKIAKPPKVKKEPKVMRKPDGTIVKRPWGERTAFFVKLFKENKTAKLTGEQIMAKAAKEFGKENVGKGAWTIEKLIPAMTEHAKKEMYGLTKADLPLHVK